MGARDLDFLGKVDVARALVETRREGGREGIEAAIRELDLEGVEAIDRLREPREGVGAPGEHHVHRVADLLQPREALCANDEIVCSCSMMSMSLLMPSLSMPSVRLAHDRASRRAAVRRTIVFFAFVDRDRGSISQHVKVRKLLAIEQKLAGVLRDLGRGGNVLGQHGRLLRQATQETLLRVVIVGLEVSNLEQRLDHRVFVELALFGTLEQVRNGRARAVLCSTAGRRGRRGPTHERHTFVQRAERLSNEGELLTADANLRVVVCISRGLDVSAGENWTGLARARTRARAHGTFVGGGGRGATQRERQAVRGVVFDQCLTRSKTSKQE